MQAPNRRMTFRRAVFLVHLTTGCLAAVVLFFLAATGFLLAWQKPVVAWQERGFRSEPAPLAAPIALDKLEAVDADPSRPVEIDFGRERRLFIDRFTGAIRGSGAARTRAFFASVTGLHRWFGTPLSDHPSAKRVSGAFTLGLLLLVGTGIFLWVPRIWTRQRLAAAMVPRFTFRGRARERSWHNVAGIWSAVPLAAIALTGAILAFAWMTHLVYWAARSPEPATADRVDEAAPKPAHADHARPGTEVSLQRIFEQTSKQAPGWRQIRIELPRPTADIVDTTVDFGNGSRPDQQMHIAYARSDGAALSLTTFSTLSLGRQIRSFVKYIHTGEGGGFAGETVAGVASLGCCILVWTGLALAIRPLLATRSSRSQLSAQQSPGKPVGSLRTD
jgi:uncharacterized iron-regulated membrane protein